MTNKNDESRASLCAARRLCVTDYLASQHAKELIKRLPRFEQRTTGDIDELKTEVVALRFKLMLTNWVIVLLVMIAMFLMLTQGAPL